MRKQMLTIYDIFYWLYLTRVVCSFSQNYRIMRAYPYRRICNHAPYGGGRRTWPKREIVTAMIASTIRQKLPYIEYERTEEKKEKNWNRLRWGKRERKHFTHLISQAHTISGDLLRCFTNEYIEYICVWEL